MTNISLCKQCGKPEYTTELRWLNGKQMCRSCYKDAFEKAYRRTYEWKDCDGERPTMDDYQEQLKVRD